MALALALAACAHPATEAPPAPVADARTPAPATEAQIAGSGATVDVSTATGSASYTVGNLRRVPQDAQIIPAKGAMYSVDVRIEGSVAERVVVVTGRGVPGIVEFDELRRRHLGQEVLDAFWADHVGPPTRLPLKRPPPARHREHWNHKQADGMFS